MKRTRILQVDRENPAEAALESAAEILRAGGLVAFPTETVYGLGANALKDEAVDRIYQAKGRPARNPLIVHVADREQVVALARSFPEEARRLVDRFWPGPLTIVLESRGVVANRVTAGGDTVAIRSPAHSVALGLLRRLDFPLAAPSANRSNHVSATSAEHVADDLDGRVDLILDAGPCEVGLESTVLDVTGRPIRLLRPGGLRVSELEAIVGPIDREQENSGSNLRSPGQLARHYAPSVGVLLQPNEAAAADQVKKFVDERRRVGWITTEPAPIEPYLFSSVLPLNPDAYGRQLFSALREMESAQVEAIVVALPPATDAWMAVRDRLLRAAATESS